MSTTTVGAFVVVHCFIPFIYSSTNAAISFELIRKDDLKWGLLTLLLMWMPLCSRLVISTLVFFVKSVRGAEGNAWQDWKQELKQTFFQAPFIRSLYSIHSAILLKKLKKEKQTSNRHLRVRKQKEEMLKRTTENETVLRNAIVVSGIYEWLLHGLPQSTFQFTLIWLRLTDLNHQSSEILSTLQCVSILMSILLLAVLLPGLLNLLSQLFSFKVFLFAVLNSFVPLGDIGTDSGTAIHLWKENHTRWATFTLITMFNPFLIKVGTFVIKVIGAKWKGYSFSTTEEFKKTLLHLPFVLPLRNMHNALLLQRMRFGLEDFQDSNWRRVEEIQKEAGYACMYESFTESGLRVV